MQFWVGGYGADHNGAPAEGIGVLLAGGVDDAGAGGALAYTAVASPAPSPSWVAAHPSLDVVYAALEERGEVQAFRRTGQTSLAPIGAPIAAGASTCHIAVNPDGRSLLASCWGDGRVVRMPLNAEGVPGRGVVAPSGTDPYAGEGVAMPDPVVPDADYVAATRALRDAAGAEFAHLVPEAEPLPEAGEDAVARPSRAHQARFIPGGLIATTDLGWDCVRIWRDDPAGLRPVQRVTLPRGSGPRHTVWHPSGHLYVLTELSREVFVLAPDAAGVWHVVGGAPAALGSLDGDTSAELALSRDGAFLYAGIRGSDTIGVLQVRGAGETLAPLALVDSGIVKPRHHVVERDTLLVAGQGSNEVVALPLDIRTGIPGRVRHRTAVPAPTCLLPVR